MADYICIKPCSFGGKAYNKGDAIPDGVVLPGRARVMTAQGFLTPVAAAAEPMPEPLVVTVPLITKDGTEELRMEADDLVRCVRILQLGAPEAVEALQELKSEEPLRLMERLDSRKTVREAAAARQQEWDEAGETADDHEETTKCLEEGDG